MSAPLKNSLTLFFIILLQTNIVSAEQTYKPMPPRFSLMQDAEKVLNNYPLGVIKMHEAFAHHGGPVRKLALPNGNRGWLYETGRESGVPNIYILQFSKDNTVIDVLHKSLHYKNGHSALQYQFLQRITPEKKMTGPGPGK